jgi:putative ABC transport system ATP-binding protein
MNDASNESNEERTMIRLENVAKVYRTARMETMALHHINLRIEEGEFVSIMGPSGCGKSTLLNVIGLLDEPSEGRVELDGVATRGYNDRKLARLRNEKIGFIFQSFHLVPDLNVVSNVEIPLLYRSMSNKERRERALAALQSVGLSSRVHHFPNELSGGQQQRVAVARAVVGEPRLILADEPTGNLDSQMGDEIMAILERLNQEQKATVVMVTHDSEQAKRTARTVRLFDGRQVA